MLTLRGVTKTFPGRSAPAIEGIDLEVRDGEILGLVGLNGAGKTTTIRVAVGLARPTAGSVEVDGRDIVHDKARASERVGWVPELFPYDPSA
jgi:ABC-2 type transport system ATP-binding protein